MNSLQNPLRMQALLETVSDLNTRTHEGKQLIDYAIAHSSVRVLRVIAERINTRRLSGMDSIHFMSAVGSVRKLQTFSNHIFSSTDREGNTPLLTAMLNQKWENVPYMISRTQTLDRFNSNGESALDLALNSKKMELATQILNYRDDSGTSFNLDAYDPFGDTLLLRAVRAGDLNRLKFLLAHGADPNRASKQGSISPLIAAIVEDRSSIVPVWLDKFAPRGLAIVSVPVSIQMRPRSFANCTYQKF